jgi:hypothetical protein
LHTPSRPRTKIWSCVATGPTPVRVALSRDRRKKLLSLATWNALTAFVNAQDRTFCGPQLNAGTAVKVVFANDVQAVLLKESLSGFDVHLNAVGAVVGCMISLEPLLVSR